MDVLKILLQLLAHTLKWRGKQVKIQTTSVVSPVGCRNLPCSEKTGNTARGIGSPREQRQNPSVRELVLENLGCREVKSRRSYT